MEIPKAIFTADYKEIETRVLALLKFKEECIGYIGINSNERRCIHFESVFGKCSLFKNGKIGKQFICDDINKEVHVDRDSN